MRRMERLQKEKTGKQLKKPTKRIMKNAMARILGLCILVSLVGCGALSKSVDSLMTSESMQSNGTVGLGTYYATDDAAYEAVYDYVESEVTMEMEESYSDGAASGTEISEGAGQTNRKLITTVDMSVETDAFDQLTERIKQQTEQLGGYIEHYNFSNRYNNQRGANYTVRIPQKNLEAFTEDIGSNCNVLSKNQYVEDVTLSYVDLESRKRVLQTEQERLLQMLEESADIETMLQIEMRLSEVQCELESMISQLRTYDDRIDYSTIHLNVSEVVVYHVVEEKSAWDRMSQGFVASIYEVGESGVNFAVWFVSAIPHLAVFALIVTVIVLVIRGCIRQGIKKRNAAKMAANKANVGNVVNTGNAGNAGNIVNTGNAGNAGNVVNTRNAENAGNVGNVATAENAGNVGNVATAENAEIVANAKNGGNNNNTDKTK